jgi:hypothetical protein
MPSTLGIVASAFSKQWTPIELSLDVWLDAADASTITQSTNVVSTWADKSGNSRNATQSTEIYKPLAGQTTLNGRNVISFDGVDSFLRIADFTASLTNVYAVVQTSTATGAQHIVRKGYTSSTSSFEYLFRFNGDDYQVILPTALGEPSETTIVLTVADQATTSPVIVGYDWNGSSVFVYENGTSIGGVTSPSSQFNVSQELRIGASHSSASDSSAPAGVLNGYLAELVLVSGALDTADRQKLEGYFAHKWGLTSVIPEEHPYKAVAPTIN